MWIQAYIYINSSDRWICVMWIQAYIYTNSSDRWVCVMWIQAYIYTNSSDQWVCVMWIQAYIFLCVVGITEELEFDCWRGKRIFLFSEAPRIALGAQPEFYSVRAGLSFSES